MSEIIIKANKLSKHFRVVSAKMNALTNIRCIFQGKKNSHLQYAIRELNFEIKAGQRIALIGNNGAGKTTLVRLIAGIYSPSSGLLEVNCIPSVLLKLGTGVIHDLSIDENIDLIAAIFGRISKNDEIEFRREVLEFAELEEQAGLAIKDLSSGQSQRIALSIFLKTCRNLVIFDESFAFVDHSFAQKCERYLKSMYDSNHTFIYCSHDPEFLRRNCTHAIWLEKGQLVTMGEVNRVLEQYSALKN